MLCFICNRIKAMFDGMNQSLGDTDNEASALYLHRKFCQKSNGGGTPKASWWR
jgi:hypothetical protein